MFIKDFSKSVSPNVPQLGWIDTLTSLIGANHSSLNNKHLDVSIYFSDIS
jgi:hypothetical protein